MSASLHEKAEHDALWKKRYTHSASQMKRFCRRHERRNRLCFVYVRAYFDFLQQLGRPFSHRTYRWRIFARNRTNRLICRLVCDVCRAISPRHQNRTKSALACGVLWSYEQCAFIMAQRPKRMGHRHLYNRFSYMYAVDCRKRKGGEICTITFFSSLLAWAS